MRWPFTTFATGTLLIFSLPLAALATVLFFTGPGWWWLAPLPLLAFILSFFRDPQRSAPGGENELVSPADGLLADITSLHDPVLDEECLRVGIFLSVFDVHVNRSPCAGEVTEVQQRPGSYYDARDQRAIDENRAATITLRRPDGRRLAVRQITGLIARRIICPATPGQQLKRGERYGMIRFGSRTELIVPTAEVAELRVKIGDKVRGGQTLLLTLRSAPGSEAGG